MRQAISRSKPPGIKPATETEIQAAIIQLLQVKGILAWRNQSIPVPIRKGKQIIGLRKANGFNVGIPDILCVIKGQLFAIEVKKPGETPDPDQIVWRDWLLKAGADWMCAISSEEVERYLRARWRM